MEDNLTSKINGYKQNILELGNAQHLNPDGGYYSYSNSSAYRIIESSAVKTYVNKKPKIVMTQKAININAMDIELLVAKDIQTAVCSLKKMVRNL